MAGVNLFVYTQGDAAIHRMDPRFKLAALIILSLSTVQCGPIAGLGLFGIGVCAAVSGGVPAFSMIRKAGVFILFLVGVVLVRGAVTPGPAVFNGAIPWLSVNGLEDGLLISWRLFYGVAGQCGFFVHNPDQRGFFPLSDGFSSPFHSWTAPGRP